MTKKKNFYDILYFHNADHISYTILMECNYLRSKKIANF